MLPMSLFSRRITGLRSPGPLQRPAPQRRSRRSPRRRAPRAWTAARRGRCWWTRVRRKRLERREVLWNILMGYNDMGYSLDINGILKKNQSNINGNSRILKWRYVSAICLALFWRYIPLGLICGGYLLFGFLKWPLR